MLKQICIMIFFALTCAKVVYAETRKTCPETCPDPVVFNNLPLTVQDWSNKYIGENKWDASTHLERSNGNREYEKHSWSITSTYINAKNEEEALTKARQVYSSLVYMRGPDPVFRLFLECTYQSSLGVTVRAGRVR